jgi:hypothetical protein
VTARDRMVLTALVAVAALAASWFLVLAPRRQDAARLADQVAQAQQQRDAAVAAVAHGNAGRRSYADDYATVARLGKAIPADDDVPSLVYQLEDAARRTGVDFHSVQLSGGSGSPPAPAPAPAAPAASGSGSSGSGASGSGSSGSGSSGSGSSAAAPTSAPATQAAAATLPPGASVGSAGLSTMPFSFTFLGDFFRLERFLAAVDRFTTVKGDAIRVSGRLLTVDGFSLTAGSKGFPHMQAKIAATSYLQPQAGPSAATTPTPASGAQPASAGARTATSPGPAPATVKGMAP